VTDGASARGAGVLGWLRGLRVRQILAVPFWLAAFAIILAGDKGTDLAGLDPMVAGRILRAALLFGVLAIVIAARLGASTAKQLQALQPGRRPVLYLRSFRADKNPVSSSTDEEVLSRIFRTLGPFVAFKEPGELLPEIGSAKMSAEWENWQELVSEQIRGAQFVVLNIGSTPSFLWEVRRALELAAPERLLIYFSMHASRDELRTMYERFTQAAAGVLKHPLPPAEELGDRRFIRFHADGRPEVFGAIERPRTAWRKVVGFLTLGTGLIALRPLVAERYRSRVSRVLEPLRLQIEPDAPTKRLWGRLTIAIGAYFAGLVALLPMVAWNLWAVRRRRDAMLVAAGLTLALVAPVNEVVALLGGIIAMTVYIGWPIVMPRVARRHIAFGGRLFGPLVSGLAIVAMLALSVLVPRGLPLAVREVEREALLEFEELRSAVASEIERFGADPTEVAYRKKGSYDGSLELDYRYVSSGLILESRLERYASRWLLDLLEGIDPLFPGLDATETAQSAHGPWRVTSYTLKADAVETGVGVVARAPLLRYRVHVSGWRVDPPDMIRLVEARLDAASRVGGPWESWSRFAGR
jgi:hypothetical protein